MSIPRPVFILLTALLLLTSPLETGASRLMDDPRLASSAEPIRFMRDPNVSGDLLAFSYQGDIWVAGRPFPLTGSGITTWG